MNVSDTKIEGLKLIQPKVFEDERGFFLESYNFDRYKEYGISDVFVQDNRSCSGKNVLRGLHFQKNYPQGKLVTVIKGSVLDVAVDLRPESKTFGQYESVILSEDNKLQMFVPKGFGHGFLVLSDTAIFDYKCTDYYKPEDESGIIWDDPDLNIHWPIKNPIVSQKDQGLACFKNLF